MNLPSMKTASASRLLSGKVRIIAGGCHVAFRAAWKARPARMFRMLSHKILRWMVPLPLIVMLAASAALDPESAFYAAAFWCQVAFYAAALGGLLAPWLSRSAVFYLPLYFVTVNLAALVGMARFALGLHRATWESPRSSRDALAAQESGEWG